MRVVTVMMVPVVIVVLEEVYTQVPNLGEMVTLFGVTLMVL